MPLTQVSPSLLDSNAQNLSFKNRIINGDMRIDQRNAGAVVSNAGSVYFIDRWARSAVNDGAVSVQRVANTAGSYPSYYMRRTVTTADASVASTDYEWIAAQTIEGLNLLDLEWGTANAKSVTVSFQVRSSMTGTFSVAVAAVGASTQYVFQNVTINAANTWESKTLTFAGNTSIAINQNTSTGATLYFVGMIGSAYQGTANTWSSSVYLGSSSNTNFMSTLNATFDIADVQLEVGAQATAFQRRPYGLELALCQRYYQTSAINVPDTNCGFFGVVYGGSASQVYGNASFKTLMRATPTVTLYDGTTAGNAFQTGVGGSAATAGNINAYGFSIINKTSGNYSTSAGYNIIAGYTASIEL